LVYKRTYTCPCGKTTVHIPHISPVVRCPKCGRTDLKRRRERDQIDRMLRNPFRYAQRFLGATLWHCVLCRIQFYDFRPSAASKQQRQQPIRSLVA